MVAWYGGAAVPWLSGPPRRISYFVLRISYSVRPAAVAAARRLRSPVTAFVTIRKGARKGVRKGVRTNI